MRWNRGFAVATLGVLVLGSFACSKAEQEARNEIRKRAVGTWTCNTDSDSYHEGPFEITVDPGGTFDVHRTNAGDLDATPTDRSGSWKVDDDGTLTVSGEEFLYLIEGSARHIVKGESERMLTAGASAVIPPNAIHAPIGGPEGARAIVFRVHVKGQPERIPVPASELEGK